jgi:type VI secretion system lysozyme-like protein
MGKSASKYVARVPLLQRLSDLDPLTASEPQPLRAYTYPELLESVRHELQLLFNTRCPLPLKELLAAPRSVVNYGLSDFSTVTPLSDAERRQLQLLLEQTVTAFEPRLRGARVRMGDYWPESGTLTCHVEAQLVTETLTEAVSFPILIKNPGQRAHGRPNP